MCEGTAAPRRVTPCQAARRSLIIRRPVHHVVPSTVKMTAVAAIQVCRFCRSMPCARLFSLLRESSGRGRGIESDQVALAGAVAR